MFLQRDLDVCLFGISRHTATITRPINIVEFVGETTSMQHISLYSFVSPGIKISTRSEFTSTEKKSVKI